MPAGVPPLFVAMAEGPTKYSMKGNSPLTLFSPVPELPMAAAEEEPSDTNRGAGRGWLSSAVQSIAQLLSRSSSPSAGSPPKGADAGRPEDKAPRPAIVLIPMNFDKQRRPPQVSVDKRWNRAGQMTISVGSSPRVAAALLTARDGHVFVSRSGDAMPIKLNNEVLPVGLDVPIADGDCVSVENAEFMVTNPDGQLSPMESTDQKFSNVVIEGARHIRTALPVKIVDGVEGTTTFDGIEGVVIVNNERDRTFNIVDTRAPKQEWSRNDPNTIIFDLTSPLKVNGQRLRQNQTMHLEHGFIIDVDSYLAVVRFDSLLLKRLPAWAKRLLMFHAERGDPWGMIRTLRQTPYGARLADDIGDVLSSKRSLVHLPEAFGIRRGVKDFMAKELEEWKDIDTSSIRTTHSLEGPLLYPLEREFFTKQNAIILMMKLTEADDLESMAQAVENSNIEYIESTSKDTIVARIRAIDRNDGGNVASLPVIVRQRVADLLEARGTFVERGRIDVTPRPDASRRTTDVATWLDERKSDIYRMIEQRPSYRNSHRDYSACELQELVYQVLERGKFIVILPRSEEMGGIRQRVQALMEETIAKAQNIYPQEMRLGRNPFSGERVHSNDMPARFRLATMLINRDSGRPIFGAQSEVENRRLTNIMQRAFGEHFSGYFDVQSRLRRALDGGNIGDWRTMTKLLSTAGPDEKALLLETYFGNSQHRDMTSLEHAFRIAALFGRSGVYREVGVTFQIHDGTIYPSLTLGDMNSVSPEDSNRFFALHTHPEMYLNENGERMGHDHDLNIEENHTMYFDPVAATISRRTYNVLFSRVDVDVFIESAIFYRSHARGARSMIYDPDTNTFTEWLFHPCGGAQMQIRMDGDRPTEIVIRFATDGSKGNTDTSYREHRQKLRKFVDENWSRWSDRPIDIRFEHLGSYDHLLRTIPFPLEPPQTP